MGRRLDGMYSRLAGRHVCRYFYPQHHAQRVGIVDRIVVWRTVLDDTRHDLPRLADILSSEEHRRRETLSPGTLRDRFVIRRAVLRMLLAQVMGVAPQDLPLHAGCFGKPFVPNGPSFSISHSAGIALVAIGRDHDIGVDVEGARLIADADVLASASFTRNDRFSYRKLCGAGHPHPFLATWTRKEARLKALGIGLAVALDGDIDEGHCKQYDVNFVPGFVACVAERL
jgi:4'-phosphopantetheinyl transferase